MSDPEPLSNEQSATLACLLEATAPKVGNVHRGADFDDLCFTDFVISSVLLGRAMDPIDVGSVGAAVLRAVRDTRAAVATNTNLGIALLIAPLAAVGVSPLAAGLQDVLNSLNADDGAAIYEAIRLAHPGGLGEADELDVNTTEAPSSIMLAMKVAEDDDFIARQYAQGYVDVFDAARDIETFVLGGESIESAIVIAHLRLLANYGDSLIARKVGQEMSATVSHRAAMTLEIRESDPDQFWGAVSELDFFLRSDGHRRNPGATADVIAAALFVLFREGRLATPFATASKT